LLQPHSYGILPGDLLDLLVEFIDTLIHCPQVLPQPA
jgi:hypothetical protein